MQSTLKGYTVHGKFKLGLRMYEGSSKFPHFFLTLFIKNFKSILHHFSI